jgi:hypothetical protein
MTLEDVQRELFEVRHSTDDNVPRKIVKARVEPLFHFIFPVSAPFPFPFPFGHSPEPLPVAPGTPAKPHKCPQVRPAGGRPEPPPAHGRPSFRGSGDGWSSFEVRRHQVRLAAFFGARRFPLRRAASCSCLSRKLCTM